MPLNACVKTHVYILSVFACWKWDCSIPRWLLTCSFSKLCTYSGLDSQGKDGGLLCSVLLGVAAYGAPKAGWASQLCLQRDGASPEVPLSESAKEWPELKSRKSQKGHIPQAKMCSALKRGAVCSQISQLWGFKSQSGRSYFYTRCFIIMDVSQKRQDMVSNLTKQSRYLGPHLGIQHEWVEGLCPLTLSPGDELPVLHGPGKYRRLKETENSVAKIWESMWAASPQEKKRQTKCLYWERNNCWLKVSKGKMEVKR